MFQDILQKDIPLNQYTTYHLGGKAKYFAVIEDEETLMESLTWAKDNNLDIFILGGGSNILVSDNGFDGLVLKLNNTKKEIEKINDEYVCTFGAGLPWSVTLNFLLEHKLTSLLDLTGIPGSTGGGVRGNAGIINKELADGILEVKAIDFSDLSLPVIKTFTKEECLFGYRDSIFKHNQIIIWEVKFVDQQQDMSEEDIKSKVSEILTKRQNGQPYMYPSAGCVFKNPNLNKFSEEITQKHNLVIVQNHDHQEVPAGFLIEQCGLKGYQIGGAQVSEKHANFLINKENAKSIDIYELICHVKHAVKNNFQIDLEEEIQLVGFDKK